ncbi:aldose epimerase family protein [Almyronema epifaneia]|uniref:Aldose epimerase n=1 Tax=Almyronema epifaneia S1 TaxID=2991925 RepID=A0ABW6IHW7_9CYAN
MLSSPEFAAKLALTRFNLGSELVYAIALKQAQYPTYVLRDQAADARLEIVTERGGLVSHWQLQGRDVLYFDAERFADASKSVRGGIPILFPICGNLPDNTYTLDGQNYPLKQHGFARDLAWEVSDRGTDQSAHLTLILNSNEETQQVYPFDFQLAFTYRLQGNTLTIEQQVTNRSDQPMPFSLGLHPYFLTTDKSQLKFEIPSNRYQDQISKDIHTFNGEFDWTAAEIDIAFFNLERPSAVVTNYEQETRLTLEWSEAYPVLVFWTVAGKDYYCLEPWTGPRNAFNTGDHLITLPPHATQTLQVKLTAELI